MKLKGIRTVIERRPFRPFLLRLTNGSEYEINEPRELGAPRDYHTLVYFGATDFVLIDRDSVVEIAVK